MRFSALLSVAIVTAVVASVPSHATVVSSIRSPSLDPEVSEVAQTPEDALAQDLALVAESRGWNLADADAYRSAEQAIGRIAELVAAERPEAFVGSALSDDPHRPPTLYIKGPADTFITDLVEAAGVEIIVADNQPFSFEELEDRSRRVHQALEAQGFNSVVTQVNITGAGVIKASVARQAGLAEIAVEILAQLPPDLRSSVELTVSDEPIIEQEDAFGR